MNTAKFKLTSNEIEISGSEKFVEEQIEKFKTLIESSYDKILMSNQRDERSVQNVNNQLGPSLVQIRNEKSQVIDADYVEVKDNARMRFENVYFSDENNFKILVEVPGDSASAQALNIILIYLWAMLQKGIETIQYSDLRRVCINTLGNRFDASNFSKTFDRNRRFFLVSGEKNNKSARLVVPGIKEAEKLLNELNNQ